MTSTRAHSGCSHPHGCIKLSSSGHPWTLGRPSSEVQNGHNHGRGAECRQMVQSTAQDQWQTMRSCHHWYGSLGQNCHDSKCLQVVHMAGCGLQMMLPPLSHMQLGLPIHMLFWKSKKHSNQYIKALSTRKLAESAVKVLMIYCTFRQTFTTVTNVVHKYIKRSWRIKKDH